MMSPQSRMIALISLFSVVSIAASVAAPSVRRPRATARQAAAPKSAHLLGLTAGVSTIENMEARFGPGLSYTGGHPHGGREWRIRGSKIYINADGFDYNGRSRVINSLSIAWKDPHSHERLTRRRLWRSELQYLGGIELGMDKTAALQIADQAMGAPSFVNGEYTWKAQGKAYYTSDRSGTYTQWTTTLTFEQDRLDGIYVVVD